MLAHTHSNLTALCPGLPVQEKGKTSLDFTEARDSEWHQLGRMQVCTSLQTTTSAPHHSVLYRPDALPAAQPTASKHCNIVSVISVVNF